MQAESADLQQTLENLKQHDPTLTVSLANDSTAGEDASSSLENSLASVETRGITEIARLVDGLTRAVLAARERATPISQQLAPLRMKVTDLKDERDTALQVRLYTIFAICMFTFYKILSDRCYFYRPNSFFFEKKKNAKNHKFSEQLLKFVFNFLLYFINIIITIKRKKIRNLCGYWILTSLYYGLNVEYSVAQN